MHNGHHCLYGELTSTNPELASVSLRMNSPVRAPCVRYRISIFKKDDTLARVYLHSVPVYSVQCTSASVQLPTYCHLPCTFESRSVCSILQVSTCGWYCYDQIGFVKQSARYDRRKEDQKQVQIIIQLLIYYN